MKTKRWLHLTAWLLMAGSGAAGCALAAWSAGMLFPGGYYAYALMLAATLFVYTPVGATFAVIVAVQRGRLIVPGRSLHSA